MNTLMKTTALGALLGVMGTAAIAQDVVVNVLSIVVDGEQEETYREAIAQAYEAANPGIDIQLEYIENEAYKAKLPTLLQSPARPEVFFSWGGGVFYEQAEAGILQDISGMASPECLANHSDAGLGSFARDGNQYGMPMYAAEVVFWYNKDLAAEAGIDVEAIETWDQFLAAVETAKAAGVTPIVVGGKDKWPMHFYYSLLAVRMLGEDAILAAAAGEDGGYANEGFVNVGEEFVRLVDLEPFQPGFMDAGYDKASNLFGDGQAIFQLMGNWDYNASKQNATDGVGLSDEQLGILSFPTVEGGAGGDNDTFGGINGWLVSEGASQEAVDFLCYMVNTENQREGGAQGLWIPVAKDASGGIENPFFRQVSENLGESQYHQLFLDQALGASVGGVVNDISADLAAGATTPQEAADLIEEARQFQ